MVGRATSLVVVAVLVLFGELLHFALADESMQEAGMEDSSYEIAEVYGDLRDQVLQWRPESDDSQGLIAVLMETGYPDAVATLVAVADGTVSMYFSNGGGIIGAGEHDAVRSVARDFLATAGSLSEQAEPAQSYPLPSEGRVRFYLVSPAGVRTAEASQDDLGYERHPFSPLFHQGHRLIASVQQHSP